MLHLRCDRYVKVELKVHFSSHIFKCPDVCLSLELLVLAG